MKPGIEASILFSGSNMGRTPVEHFQLHAGLAVEFIYLRRKGQVADVITEGQREFRHHRAGPGVQQSHSSRIYDEGEQTAPRSEDCRQGNLGRGYYGES